jgi:hypothetical protein
MRSTKVEFALRSILLIDVKFDEVLKVLQRKSSIKSETELE